MIQILIDLPIRQHFIYEEPMRKAFSQDFQSDNLIKKSTILVDESFTKLSEAED